MHHWQPSAIRGTSALTLPERFPCSPYSGPAFTVGPQFAQPYLAAMPVPPKSAYVEGPPTATGWDYHVPDGTTHHFMPQNKIRKDVCMEVNKAHGVIGNPAVFRPELVDVPCLLH